MYAGGMDVGADCNLDSSKSPLSHFSLSDRGGNAIHYLISPEEKCYQGW